jgi:hypothetical protein
MSKAEMFLKEILENVKVSAVIMGLLKKWEAEGFTPKEVNSGNCDEFSDQLVDLLGKGAIIRETDWGSTYPGHVWVEYKGKHYDAETPEGVTNWKMLPILKG